MKTTFFSSLSLSDIVRAVNPFLHRIPAGEQKDYILELVHRMLDSGMDTSGGKYLIVINVAVITCEKVKSKNKNWLIPKML